LILTCFGNHSFADIIQKKDTVSGIVIDKNKTPLPGAKVEIIGQPYSYYTDLDGRFIIKYDHGAKKVRVTYPKLKETKKKIQPDMTIQIGRSWKQAPEHYQWFVGANIGFGYSFIHREDNDDYWDTRSCNDHFYSSSFSIMGGRVKTVGWYMKAFFNPETKVKDPQKSYYPDNSRSETGLILGGMVRLKCPLHFCLGAGLQYTDFSKYPTNIFNKCSFALDCGLLFRIKDNFGINWSATMGIKSHKNLNTDISDLYLSVSDQIGFCYFFN
ncbi:MAG: carboxypeptidase-like regulatory domain-containing protein, partial [Muribaculaceae bacterium]|nr:carboxypeptidase-like regulatory domain-containing protein [Muribaculaceae bacterium]